MAASGGSQWNFTHIRRHFLSQENYIGNSPDDFGSTGEINILQVFVRFFF